MVTISNSGNPVSVTWSGTVVGSGAIPCTVNSGGTISGGPATIPPTQVNTYPASLTVPTEHECQFTISVCATGNGTIHQVANACATFTGLVQSNVLVAKFCLLVGPAAVNLSDTNGRYMWVICEVGNVTNTAEPVTISMTITGPVPAGCTRTQNLIIPGATQFTMAASEQKIIVHRVRFECHAPATIQVINQTVTFTVTHVNDDGPADVETFISDNTKTTTKQVIIQ